MSVHRITFTRNERIEEPYRERSFFVSYSQETHNDHSDVKIHMAGIPLPKGAYDHAFIVLSRAANKNHGQ